MTFRRLLALVVAFAAFPAVAQAHATIIEPSESHFPYQRWANKAKVPTPETTITVIESARSAPDWPCATVYSAPVACSIPTERTIWVDSRALKNLNPRDTFWHELGHIFDYEALTEADRAWFTAKVGDSGLPWLSPETHFTPGETFAELYSLCALVGPILPEFGELVVMPGARVLGPRLQRRLCRFIANAAS